MGYRHSGGDVVEGGRVFELEKKVGGVSVGGVRRGGGGGCVERDGGGSPGGLRHAWHGVGTRIVPVHRLARVAKGRSRTLHLGHINEYVLVSSDLGRTSGRREITESALGRLKFLIKTDYSCLQKSWPCD